MTADRAGDERSPERDALLTDAEREVIAQAGRLWNAMCAAIPAGATRDADLGELVLHVHAIQHAFMANAAARAYPTEFRRLGSTLRLPARAALFARTPTP